MVAPPPKPTEFSLWREALALGVGLAFVYFASRFLTFQLAGWILRGRHLLGMPPSFSNFSFTFNHLFVFTFFPAVAGGCVASHVFRRRASEFVWLCAASVLLYKILTFHTAHSVLGEVPGLGPWHYYFDGDFLIPDFRTWEEFWQQVAASPDMTRGMAQADYTGPFYASLGYSAMAFVYRRFIARCQ